MNKKKKSLNSNTFFSIVITSLIIFLVLLIFIPATMQISPKEYSVRYVKAFIDFQNAVQQILSDPDYIETVDSKHFAAIQAQDVCRHIASNLKTKGTISCDSEGSSDSPNFILESKYSYWGIGGQNFIAPSAYNPYLCSDNRLGYYCYKTIWVDVDGSKGKNQKGVDQYRIRLRYDGYVDLDSSWKTEIGYLEFLDSLI